MSKAPKWLDVLIGEEIYQLGPNGEKRMKKSRKLKNKLAGRQYDWEQMVARKPEMKKAYRKPGSNK